MASHSSELPLGNHQARADPALNLIAWLAEFPVEQTVSTIEGGLDHIGTAQSQAELINTGDRVWNPKTWTGQGRDILCRSGTKHWAGHVFIKLSRAEWHPLHIEGDQPMQRS